MIGKVQLNNKPSFGAKFYNYPHCLTNPEIKEKPFMLDSKEPSGKIEDFLMNEVRYNSLAKIMPEHAKELFEKNKNEALARYNRYKKMSENNF